MTGLYVGDEHLYNIALYKINVYTDKAELLSVLREVKASEMKSIIYMLTPLINLMNDPRTTIKYQICIS